MEKQSFGRNTPREPFYPDPEPDVEPEEAPEAEEPFVEQDESLFKRLRFTWTEDDTFILDRIRGVAAKRFSEKFAGALSAMEKLYSSWENLTGQDIDTALMDLQVIQFKMAMETDELRSDAIFAKMRVDDVRDANWGTGRTTDERKAHANAASQVDRYYAFLLYCLWSRASTFLRQIEYFTIRLRDIRNWRIQDQK